MSAYRRWRVRHSYPEAVVELVRMLAPLFGARALSRLLDIPLSVIYRWRASGAVQEGMHGNACAENSVAIAALVARCDEQGFRFGERLRAAGSPRIIAPSALQCGRDATHCTSSEPHCANDDDIADSSPRTSADAVGATAAIAAPTPFGDGAVRARGGRRYVFDARKQRPSLGVRRRLEAARRMIEAEYFSDIDCRSLADVAQMSRHHFIRMFSDFYGMSPHRCLARARIGAAKRLLLSSREPIEVIAAGVGFRSGPSLNRAFKQIEGATVSKFCRTARKNPPRSIPASLATAPAPDYAAQPGE